MDEGTIGETCLHCLGPCTPTSSRDRALCSPCIRRISETSGAAWLVVSAPTEEGALWKGRYFPDGSFRDCLHDALFEPGTIVERYIERIYQDAYKVTGAPSLVSGTRESQQLLAMPQHRARGDGKVFRP